MLGSKLIYSIIKSDFNKCEDICNSNQSLVRLKNNNKRSPLSVACSVGNLDIVKMLYYKGAEKDLNEKDKSLYYPLFIAIREGHIDIIRWLYEVKGFDCIKDCDYINQMPLWFICNHEYIKIENRLQIALFFFEKGIITGNSGNYVDDVVYNDIKKYIQDNEFRTKFNNLINDHINKYIKLEIFLKGSIFKKSDNIYKLDNLSKSLIFDYTGIIFGKKLKNFKSFIK